MLPPFFLRWLSPPVKTNSGRWRWSLWHRGALILFQLGPRRLRRCLCVCSVAFAAAYLSDLSARGRMMLTLSNRSAFISDFALLFFFWRKTSATDSLFFIKWSKIVIYIVSINSPLNITAWHEMTVFAPIDSFCCSKINKSINKNHLTGLLWL